MRNMMRIFGLFVAVLGLALTAEAKPFDCAKVTTQVYGFPLDGATVDPIDGVFNSYIQDVGGGFELTKDQISSFGSARLDRATECTESWNRSATKAVTNFVCQSKTSPIEINATLTFDKDTNSGVYEGTIVGGPTKTFSFIFSACTPQ